MERSLSGAHQNSNRDHRNLATQGLSFVHRKTHWHRFRGCDLAQTPGQAKPKHGTNRSRKMIAVGAPFTHRWQSSSQYVCVNRGFTPGLPCTHNNPPTVEAPQNFMKIKTLMKTCWT